MPTLLEKPSVTPAHHLPAHVLKTRHRWERWRWVLSAVSLLLAATLLAVLVLHPSWQTPGDWKTLLIVWSGGLLLSVIAGLVTWKLAPDSLTETAQILDRDLAAKNRLEAAAHLHDSTTPLAHAQREETTAYLAREQQVRPLRAFSWLLGSTLLLVLLNLFLALVWMIPLLLGFGPPALPPTPQAVPKASIIWKSPEPETKANPVEEVPTVAEIESTTGMKNLTLEISINGEAKKSTPLPAEPFSKAGQNALKTSVYMDELGVEPYDIVSYYIHGERITDQKVPATNSAIQFIQVRRFRDDTEQAPAGNSSRGLALLTMLKLAQIRSIKENFILTHTDLAVNDPVRVKENDRVGKNEAELSTKTEEIAQLFINEGAPPDMINILRQAEPLMDDASKKILANQNRIALPPQEKALGYIVEVEKFIRKALAPPKSAPSRDNPEDPFKDKQNHELKKRFESAAGQLQTLAEHQTKLAKEMNQPGASTPNGAPHDKGSSTDASPGQTSPPASPANNPGDMPVVPLPPAQAVDPFTPDAEKGTFDERQTRVLQGIESLLDTNKVLPQPVIDALEDARKHAMESVHQLDQANEPGAREPASSTAQDLQRALTEMNNAGEKAGQFAMEQAQHQLNNLAQKMRDLAKSGSPDAPKALTDLAAQVRDIQKQLEDAADQQQEGGSEKSAQRLNNLANQINLKNVVKDLGEMSTKGLDPAKAENVAQTLEGLAGQAATGLTPGKPSAQDIARLVNSLERSRANLAHLASLASNTPNSQPGLTPGTQPGQAPGQQPASSLGQKPGTQPGQAPAQHPGSTPGQTPGTQPGQAPGQQPGSGPGQKPGTQPGQGSSQTPSPQPGQGQGQGEQQGTSPDQNPSGQPGQDPGQGNGVGQNPNGQPGGQGQGQGQGTGQGQSETADNSQPEQGQGEGQGQGQGHGHNTAQNSSSHPQEKNPNATDASPSQMSDAQASAFKEVLAQVKDDTQQSATLVTDKSIGQLQSQLKNIPNDYRKVDPTNIVHAYQALTPPLDKLIAELRAMLTQTEREELLKQPNLDDAPAPYRAAVSDYFETMSRDYHPDNAAEDSKKP